MTSILIANLLASEMSNSIYSQVAVGSDIFGLLCPSTTAFLQSCYRFIKKSWRLVKINLSHSPMCWIFRAACATQPVKKHKV